MAETHSNDQIDVLESSSPQDEIPDDPEQMTVSSSTSSSRHQTRELSKVHVIIGSIQIFWGSLNILYNVFVLFVIECFKYNVPKTSDDQILTGAGIWTGIVAITAGSFGVVSQTRAKTCYSTAAMVLSIVAVSCSMQVIVYPSAGMRTYFRSKPDKYTSETPYLFTVFIILGAAELLTASFQSTYACKYVCSDYTDYGQPAGTKLISTSNKVFGGIQVVCGLLSIGANVAFTAAFSTQPTGLITSFFAGVWGGAIFVFAGSYGVASGYYLRKGYLVCTIVLSTLGAVIGFNFIVAWTYHVKIYRRLFFDGILALIGLIEFVAAVGQSSHACVYVRIRPSPGQNTKSKLHEAFGFIQVISGICVLILDIICTFCEFEFGAFGKYPFGVWSGTIFTITGTFGIITAYQHDRGYLFPSLVMSVVATAAAVLIITVDCDGLLTIIAPGEFARIFPIIIYAFSIIIGVIEVISAVSQGVLCCRLFCKRSPPRMPLFPV